MISVQGVAIVSRNVGGSGLVETRGNPFVPMAVNVAGQRREPEWRVLRVYGAEDVLVRAVRFVRGAGNVLVRSYVSLRESVYVRKDTGEPAASVSFSADIVRVQVYDNEARAWRPFVEVLSAVEDGGEEFMEELLGDEGELVAA